MSVESGFDDLQTTVNVDPDDLREARRRRDLFKAALSEAADVVEVRPSGSLARGTHKDPINDVDIIAMFRSADHLDWGQPGPSALVALEHVRRLINDSLGTSGTGDVRHTLLRNHSVKCFLDDPEDPDAFTVDATPALDRIEGGIWIPEQNNSKWIASDPQYLIDLVAARHAEWNQFARLVRVLKRWNADHGNHMKSLTVEVVALTHLPILDRPQAIASFFAAAQEAVWSPIEDPAGLCGEIQPDLDRKAASDALSAAADLAARAIEAADRNEAREAQCIWNEVFGDIYPKPVGGCGSSVAPALISTTPKRRVVDSPQG